MKAYFNFIVCLFPFSRLRIFFLRLLGNDVSFKSKIGWGFYLVNNIEIASNAVIRPLNLFKIDKIKLEEKSFIKEMNLFKGPFSLILGKESGIGRQNKFRRSNYPISYGDADLILGKYTFLTSNNFFDLTKSIEFGNNTQLGGVDSQFWTHGYVHADKGRDRIRVDGCILIKDNVYIGSKCLFNPGVVVGNSINIGGNSVISKDLLEEGMYVNQPLRLIKNNLETTTRKLKPLNSDFKCIERVYTK